MTNKKSATLVAMALLIAMVGLVPMASAGDNLVRSFFYTIGAEEDFKGSGTGVYDNVNGEVCVVSILGFRQGVLGSGIYYENYRQTGNLKAAEHTITGAGEIGTDPLVNCPPPVGEGNQQNVHSSDITVRAVVSSVSIDHSVCNQGSSFVDCIIDPSTSTAGLYRCEAPAFMDDAVKQGALNPYMSTYIDSCSSTSAATQYYNAGATGSDPYADSWYFDGDNWGTDYSLIQVNDMGAGSGFVVTCMSTGYVAIDNSVVPPTFTTGLSGQGHDWFWIVDTGLSPVSPTLDELYDLNGNDGCPSEPASWATQPLKSGTPLP